MRYIMDMSDVIYMIVVILLAVLHLITSARVDDLECIVNQLRKDKSDD